MRAFLSRTLIFAIVIGIGFLGYACYSNSYVSGYKVSYSLGYDDAYSQDEAECDKVQDEDSYNDGLVHSQNLPSISRSIEIRNPTFKEAMDFIIADRTNRNKWVRNVYECRHFATDVCNNARDASWNCAFVLLCYEHRQHVVIAFNTIDRGLIYIDPQNDEILYPEVGNEYQGREIKEILVVW